MNAHQILSDWFQENHGKALTQIEYIFENCLFIAYEWDCGGLGSAIAYQDRVSLAHAIEMLSKAELDRIVKMLHQAVDILYDGGLPFEEAATCADHYYSSGNAKSEAIENVGCYDSLEFDEKMYRYGVSTGILKSTPVIE